jgi:NADH-quinone oxidoreductase subunit F
MTVTEISPLHTAIEPYIPLGRSGLLPALHAAQKLYGWVSEETAVEISKALRVPLADIHGVIEFYSLFYNEPTSKHTIRVCTDVACALKGGEGILNHLCEKHGLKPGQTTEDLSLTIEASPCLGLCEHAPVALVDNDAETNIDIENNTFELGRPPSNVYGSIRLLTANCGNGTTSLAGYGKYSASPRRLG